MGHKPLSERFWAKIGAAKSAGCWEWPGGKTSLGYGLIQDNKRVYLAHRVSWEMHNGTSIPDGVVILHLCDNPSCVNPLHLSAGSMADNSADMCRKGRQARGEKIPNAVLDEAAVKALRDLRASGAKTREIAAAFGISQTTVCQVISRKTWKQVA